MGAGGKEQPLSKTVEAGRAFFARLDTLTTRDHPRRDECSAAEANSEVGPHFSIHNWDSARPVLVAAGRLLVQLFRPYTVVALTVVAFFGFYPEHCGAAATVLLASMIMMDEQFRLHFMGGKPREAPGLYCQLTPRNRAIIERTPALNPPHYKGTPWVVSGDMATIYPFLAFAHPKIAYTRRWLAVGAGSHGSFHGDPRTPLTDRNIDEEGKSTHDRETGVGGEGNKQGQEEAVALDICLAEEGLDPSRPFYLVLHGLTGGSQEEYVRDMVLAALRRGCGVCVMVARGLMDTPLWGDELFHGARTTDVGATVSALKSALPQGTPLSLVGFSMGGIIAANYTTISGTKSGLSSTVSLSGSFDTRHNMVMDHSLKIWQPLLTRSLKMISATKKLVKRGINLLDMARAATVVDFDSVVIAPYNGYESVEDYYVDMSAASSEEKILNLRSPMLAIHAVDDPIMTPEGAPIGVVDRLEDLFILLTKKGGHVGWPTGWFPSLKKWEWMSSSALDFSEAVAEVSRCNKGPGLH